MYSPLPDAHLIRLQLLDGPDGSKSLRPVLEILLRTGGVPPSMAEDIANILGEAGYESFRQTDNASLKRRRAQALRDMDPEQMTDRLQLVSAAVAATPNVQATHSRVGYERIAAREYEISRPKPLLLAPEHRIFKET